MIDRPPVSARDDGPVPIPVLIDVSRSIWRYWSGRLPTGIDRVCLAYVEHFGPRAQAVVQWKRRRIVLTADHSRRLMALLVAPGPPSRQQLIRILGSAIPSAFAGAPQRGQLYLNIGHTGLNDDSLVAWIAHHGLRAVHLIHDLIPIETPEFCRPGEADRHVQRMTNALISASGIIGNSEATLTALRNFAATHSLPCPPMVAAWLAGDVLPSDVVPTPAEHPYFVVVGTIEGRKNHLLLLQLWKRLVERLGDAAPRLVLVGQRGWEAEGAFALLDRSLALQGMVIERGRCDDRELAGLLKGARALLMPSFAEGFGMPVIEAMQLGAPVIASDLAVFREIADTIPTFISVHDAGEWERTILDFCGPSPERARQIAAMRAYRAPSWEGHFAIVERWLETLPAR
ncbi:glycosyltransferase family 1 protein [Sphingomonas sp. PB2P12]|uniref:glycosyltransferase family 4 protein n=1 Tax=Sphingomonas sandaracina TaxID=3096157 RepID=UPI002FCA44B6